MRVTAAFSLEARQYDAVNAFANSQIDKVIHYDCLEGYLKEGSCLQLLHSLYELRRAPLLWLKEFAKTL